MTMSRQTDAAGAAGGAFRPRSRGDFGGFTAVKNVDLDVHHARVHALIGPNGAGKTTVFNLLTKFLQPTARHDHAARHRTSPGRRPTRWRRMGLVRSFQISAVFPHLTVLDNVRGGAAAAEQPRHPVLEAALVAEQLERARRRTDLDGRPGQMAQRHRRRPLLWPQARAGNRHDAGARPEGAAARRADGRHGPGGRRRHRRPHHATLSRTAPS